MARPIGVLIRPKQGTHVPDNGVIALRDKGRPLPEPKYGEKFEDVQPVCSICKYQHRFKTTHLRLNAGQIIVSESLWQYIQKFPDNGGFEFVNHVENPPAQGVQPGRETKLIEKYPNNEITSLGGGSFASRMAAALRKNEPDRADALKAGRKQRKDA